MIPRSVFSKMLSRSNVFRNVNFISMHNYTKYFRSEMFKKMGAALSLEMYVSGWDRYPKQKDVLYCECAGKQVQWCSVTGQGATGTNCSIGSSIWTWGRTSSLWGWRSTGTGCLERLWSFLLWRYSGPTWLRSCAACCRWPCFSRGVGLRWPREVPSNPEHSVILWFWGI